jgi:hypothetical protein
LCIGPRLPDDTRLVKQAITVKDIGSVKFFHTPLAQWQGFSPLDSAVFHGWCSQWWSFMELSNAEIRAIPAQNCTLPTLCGFAKSSGFLAIAFEEVFEQDVVMDE